MKLWKKMIFCFLPLFFSSAGLVFASTHGAGAEAASHHGGGWGVIDNYKLWNFVVLVSVLFVILRKPVAGFFSDRVKNLKEEISSLEKKKAKAEEDLLLYEKKLESLEEEVKVIVDTYVEQGEKAKERILEEAKNSAEKLKEQASRKIDQEFQMAKESLSKEVFEKAVAEAENLIKKNISDQDQQRIVEEYMEKVVA